MTSCVYFSPGDPPVPTLIADTVWSIGGRRLPGVLPASIASAAHYKTQNTTKLVRKISILNDRTAIALAGRETSIVDYLTTASGLIDVMTEGGRPMRALGDLANSHDRVHIVGAYVDVKDGKYFINSVGLNHAQDHDQLGVHYAVGSGAEELLDLCIQYGEKTLHWEPQPIPGTVIAMLLPRGIGNRRLYDELTSVQEQEKDWGGFLESAFFDYDAMKWSYGLDSLHLFFLTEYKSGKIITRMVPHSIAYHPGKDHGKILSLSIVDDDCKLKQFNLHNHLLGEAPSSAGDLEFWRSWKPSTTSVTFGPPANSNHSVVTSMVANEDLEKVHFEIADKKVVFGIDDDLAASLGYSAAQIWTNETEHAERLMTIKENLGE